MQGRLTGREVTLSLELVGGERRVVTCAHGDGFVIVCERTSGDLTQALYGNDESSRFVRIDDDSVQTLGERLGIGAGGDGSDHDTLAAIFTSGEVYLSDFMDALDGAGIAYTYAFMEGDAEPGIRPR